MANSASDAIGSLEQSIILPAHVNQKIDDIVNWWEGRLPCEPLLVVQRGLYFQTFVLEGGYHVGIVDNAGIYTDSVLPDQSFGWGMWSSCIDVPANDISGCLTIEYREQTCSIRARENINEVRHTDGVALLFTSAVNLMWNCSKRLRQYSQIPVVLDGFDVVITFEQWMDLYDEIS